MIECVLLVLFGLWLCAYAYIHKHAFLQQTSNVLYDIAVLVIYVCRCMHECTRTAHGYIRRRL